MFDAIRNKLKVWFTVGVGTVAAVLVAGLLGAFGALPKPPVPVLPAGSPIETGQWLVAPRASLRRQPSASTICRSSRTSRRWCWRPT